MCGSDEGRGDGAVKGTDGFELALILAMKRLDLLTELVKRDRKASLPELQRQVDEAQRWAMTGPST